MKIKEDIMIFAKYKVLYFYYYDEKARKQEMGILPREFELIPRFYCLGCPEIQLHDGWGMGTLRCPIFLVLYDVTKQQRFPALMGELYVKPNELVEHFGNMMVDFTSASKLGQVIENRDVEGVVDLFADYGYPLCERDVKIEGDRIGLHVVLRLYSSYVPYYFPTSVELYGSPARKLIERIRSLNTEQKK